MCLSSGSSSGNKEQHQ
jgi:hypothetical protein